MTFGLESERLETESRDNTNLCFRGQGRSTVVKVVAHASHRESYDGNTGKQECQLVPIGDVVS